MTDAPFPHDRNPDASHDPGPLYRPNVGVVLFNREGLVWMGHRPDAGSANDWQFPQGGIDAGEDHEAAARRELQEETGVTSISLLGRTYGWIAYDFPSEVLANRKRARGFKGQKQVWFAYRFEGEDAEVNLRAHHEIEFDRWRWAALSEAPEVVASFKRNAYDRVVAAFSHFAAG